MPENEQPRIERHGDYGRLKDGDSHYHFYHYRQTNFSPEDRFLILTLNVATKEITFAPTTCIHATLKVISEWVQMTLNEHKTPS